MSIHHIVAQAITHELGRQLDEIHFKRMSAFEGNLICTAALSAIESAPEDERRRFACRLLQGVEPTKRMILSAESAIDDHKDSGWDSGGDGESYNSYEYFTAGVELAVFRAMITEGAKGVE